MTSNSNNNKLFFFFFCTGDIAAAVVPAYMVLAQTVHTLLPGRRFVLSPYEDVLAGQPFNNTVAEHAANLKLLARAGADVIAVQEVCKAFPLFHSHKPTTSPRVVALARQLTFTAIRLTTPSPPLIHCCFACASTVHQPPLPRSPLEESTLHQFATCLMPMRPLKQNWLQKRDFTLSCGCVIREMFQLRVNSAHPSQANVEAFEYTRYAPCTPIDPVGNGMAEVQCGISLTF